MLQVLRHTGIALLLVATAMVASPVADARVPPSEHSPAMSTLESGAALPQARVVQTSASGFDWGDAGIGAALTVALIGAGAAIITSRRRLVTRRHQHARHSVAG